jgi:hypothetical protein
MTRSPRTCRIPDSPSDSALGACIYLSPSDLDALGLDAGTEVLSYRVDPEAEELLLDTGDSQSLARKDAISD